MFEATLKLLKINARNVRTAVCGKIFEIVAGNL